MLVSRFHKGSVSDIVDEGVLLYKVFFELFVGLIFINLQDSLDLV